MSVLLKKITLFVKIMLKNPSKFKRVSKMTENATHRTSNHYRFLKLDTIAFLVVYNIYGPTCGVLRKTVDLFFSWKKHFMAGMIIDILYIFWHKICQDIGYECFGGVALPPPLSLPWGEDEAAPLWFTRSVEGIGGRTG